MTRPETRLILFSIDVHLGRVNNRRRPSMHHWFLTFALLLPVSATAATYDVSPSGSDSAPCTADAPCRTIRHGLERLGSGDTLTIHAGTYAENNLHPPSGVTVQGAPGEQVILHPTGNTAPGFDITANGVTIRNLTIDGSGGGISYGIRIVGQNNTIESVEVA